MKKIFLVVLILFSTFLAATIIVQKVKADALFNRHIIGGGLDGTTGVPLKVGSDGTLYLTN